MVPPPFFRWLSVSLLFLFLSTPSIPSSLCRLLCALCFHRQYLRRWRMVKEESLFTYYYSILYISLDAAAAASTTAVVLFNHSQSTTSGYRERNGVVAGPHWDSKEAWSELVFTVDNYLFARLASNSVHGHRDNNLKVRCETNIYQLYRGAAETDLIILDDPWPFNGLTNIGAKVSPTTDLRGSNNPDNSALTGSSLAWGKTCFKHWLLRLFLLLSIVAFS